jgi:hypothetical protein
VGFALGQEGDLSRADSQNFIVTVKFHPAFEQVVQFVFPLEDMRRRLIAGPRMKQSAAGSESGNPKNATGVTVLAYSLRKPLPPIWRCVSPKTRIACTQFSTPCDLRPVPRRVVFVCQPPSKIITQYGKNKLGRNGGSVSAT